MRDPQIYSEFQGANSAIVCEREHTHTNTHLTPHRDKATVEQANVPEDTVVTIRAVTVLDFSLPR